VGSTPLERTDSAAGDLGEVLVSPSALIRASGLATVVGGILFALFPLLHPNHDLAGYTGPIWVPVHLMPNVGAMLVLFGLVGLLARQLNRAGLFGVVSFVVAILGTASFLMGTMIELFVIPFMGIQNPAFEEGPPPPGLGEAFLVISLLLGVGHLLLGVATYRARVLPHSVGTLMIVGAVAMLTLEKIDAMFIQSDTLWVVAIVLFGAGLSWLGFTLWSNTPDQALLQPWPAASASTGSGWRRRG
jgi:hypothetical protein